MQHRLNEARAHGARTAIRLIAEELDSLAAQGTTRYLDGKLVKILPYDSWRRIRTAIRESRMADHHNTVSCKEM